MTDTETRPPFMFPGGSPPLVEEAIASVALDGETQSLSITPHEIVRRLGLPIGQGEGMHYCPVCNMGAATAQGFGPHFNIHWREAGVARDDVPTAADRSAPCPFCAHRGRRDLLIAHLKTEHEVDNGVARGIARTAGFDLTAYLARVPDDPRGPEGRVSKGDTAHTPQPKKQKQNERGQHLIECAEKCGAVQRRKNMTTHLRRVHDYTPEQARGFIKTAPQSRFKSPQKRTNPTRRKRDGNGNAVDANTTESPDARWLASPPAVIETPPPSSQGSINFTAINPTDIAIGVVQSQANGTIPTDLLPNVIDYIEHTRDIVAKLRAARA